jgi:hypothetical protein
MKHFFILLFLVLSLGISWASSPSSNPDSCKVESLVEAMKSSKKFILYVKVTSPTCVGAKHVSRLKSDKDLASFYDFEVLTSSPDSSEESVCTSYISYQGIFLGTIYGVPTKGFLISLRPVITDMIKDPKIMSQRKDSIASVIGAQ